MHLWTLVYADRLRASAVHCRAGRRVRARASVYKHCDAISWSYSEQRPIPTVIRLRSTSPVRHQPSRQPVLRRVTLCAPYDINSISNDALNRHVQNADEVSDSVYVFNAAGLSKPHAVEHLTADLTSYDIDIAIVTETHFKSKHSDAISNIPGYTIYRRDRAGRRGGGVATYVRSTLQSTAWAPANEDKTFELQWTRVGCNFVGTVYHPPKPLYRPELLLDYIESTIDEINQNFVGCNITLAGDFNQLSDREISERTGLTSIVHQPTRAANILDRIYVSHPRYSIVRVVSSVVKSDHQAVVAYSDSKRISIPKVSFQRTYRPVTPDQHSHGLTVYLNH